MKLLPRNFIQFIHLPNHFCCRNHQSLRNKSSKCICYFNERYKIRLTLTERGEISCSWGESKSLMLWRGKRIYAGKRDDSVELVYWNSEWIVNFHWTGIATLWSSFTELYSNDWFLFGSFVIWNHHSQCQTFAVMNNFPLLICREFSCTLHIFWRRI